MFEVTEKASEMIKDFLKDREEIPSIRIMLSQGGWSGPSLGMALDELRDEDETFNDRGIIYIIQKELFEQIKPVKVDYVNSEMGSGFSISSEAQMGGSCGGSCSC